MKKISILGSTGSIGVNTLELVAAHEDKFEIVGLTAGKNLDLLKLQIDRFKPKQVAVASQDSARKLRSMVGRETPEIVWGVEGMIAVAAENSADLVVAAIVGAAGLVPTVAAIMAGKDVALANKETLVTAGHLIMAMVKKKGVNLYPVDSEHSAIFQSLLGHRREDVERLILTASGGPFLHHPLASLKEVSVKDALTHPNWSMGQKITIDSATMMNKGLEVIEAHWLFDMAPESIDVVIHPQSIIHSMVQYCDGCVMAQLGIPDMKAPIAFALTFPERIETGVEHLDLTRMDGLTFLKPDLLRFPALGLAYRAMGEGESMPAVMNAANEIAVDAFLSGRIVFTDITATIARTMDTHTPHAVTSVEAALSADQWGRAKARELLGMPRRGVDTEKVREIP